MIIPKSLIVGFTKYAVLQPATLPYYRVGFTDYGKRTIKVAHKSALTGKQYDTVDRHITFWHELTHAILHDMGHPLHNNETFVERFSSRLAKAIRTAEL